MWEIIKSGGPIMWPLLACSVLALAFIIERLIILYKIPKEREAQEELERVERILAEQGEEAAATYCSKRRGPLNYIFSALMKRFDRLMIERRELRDTRQQIVELAKSAGAGEMGEFMVVQKELSDIKDELIFEVEEAGRAYLGRNLTLLGTIGVISPLLGLLGTIVGMIVAFRAIAIAGTGDPKVVAGGISQALVTTATGLTIAIPTIVAHRFLARKAETSLERLEVYGHAFVNSLIMSAFKVEV